MTPETSRTVTAITLGAYKLQRSRGRMTPETCGAGVSAAPEVEGASTEPGPDDPGDSKEEVRALREELLQRSRGRMTPETITRTEGIWTSGIFSLQRSRGRMTPETCPDRGGDAPRSHASTEPGPDDPGDRAPGRPEHVVRRASTEPGPDDPGDSGPGVVNG